MKNLFVCFAMFITMLFFAACGADEDSPESEIPVPGCHSGDFSCEGSESYYCNSQGSWVYDARCENGCDSSTGRCYSDSGDSSDSGSNNDHGDYSDSGNGSDHGDSDSTSECTPGKYKCDGSYSYYCSNGYWNSGEYCSNGCDSSTGKCKNNSSTSECTPGKYKCDGYYSYYCSNGYWDSGEYCSNGCDSSTGKCYSDDSSCSSGDSKCKSSAVYSCGSDGIWEFKETCKYGCSDSTSTAKCNAAECSSEERKCSNNKIYFCDDGFWKVEKSCSYGCDSSTLTCKQSNTCYKIDGKTWTDKADSPMSWQDAQDYCNNLTVCGYSDWHLPTISELRTLIQNCPATQTGGECGVSDSCLSYECRNDACRGCSSDSSGKYSKLGDTNNFWSSSVRSDKSDSAWGVHFYSGYVDNVYKSYSDYYVRCVR